MRPRAEAQCPSARLASRFAVRPPADYTRDYSDWQITRMWETQRWLKPTSTGLL